VHPLMVSIAASLKGGQLRRQLRTSVTTVADG
jgi:hypothetical protein